MVVSATEMTPRRETTMVFKIQPHDRLQEWVAQEKGYFAEESLQYVFQVGDNVLRHYQAGSVQSTEGAPPEVRNGAFEAMEAGRTCDISAACHWAVSMAATTAHGKMWGKAYSVTPAGVYVAPESPIRRADDLLGVEVGVGHHSGSHFSALQALEPFVRPGEARLKFSGRPNDRVAQLLDRTLDAANVFGLQTYIVEQQGFRKVLDTSFMIGFLVADDADRDDVEKYFRALRRAQRDIDVAHQDYTHYYLNEIADEFKSLVDVRAFGPGERIVFEPYTREVYEQTHRWMGANQLFGEEQAGTPSFESAVLV
jgi:NitT/TauT family transport system substrate-binding protein